MSVGANQDVNTMEMIWQFPEKLKVHLPCDHMVHAPGYVPRRNEGLNPQKAYTRMHTPASFKIAKTGHHQATIDGRNGQWDLVY